MKFEKTEVFNFKSALRGMRNPMNSWDKSDSIFYIAPEEYYDSIYYELVDWCKDQIGEELFPTDDEAEEAIDTMINKVMEYSDTDCLTVRAIGQKDMELARRLINAGSEHRKFLRQIFVSVDITAPLYWWKEFDTYKVGTVANSTSTMHKLASTPITLDCFEIDDLNKQAALWARKFNPNDIIEYLEFLRQKYLETKDIAFWKELIRWLPESWLQTRTVTMNYENLRNMYHQRQNHKLTEWHSFCKWVETLPYATEFIVN